ncbi:MAG: Ni/Fe-hydrogenase, b-type cytochrome subunit [Propionibacteriaceae bacterium]|nr:Ni/Fe-hydrogenase, b-type cytochrome subunit [Propionibacteriaceae bacterium]
MTTTAQETKPLAVGGAFTLRRLSESQVMTLAAAAAPDSVDPVDVALAENLREHRPDITLPQVDVEDIDPASRARRFSLTRVRHLSLESGPERDVIIMRGNLADVVAKVKLSREQKALIRRNANWAETRGWRPLAVATAIVGADDRVGEFRFQGFVNIGEGKTGERIDNGPANWARVSVWSTSLRVQHWMNVACIFILSCSGYYIMDPFFGTNSPGEATGFLMGYVRLIHFVTAFVWLMVGLTRLVVSFTSRDPMLRWNRLWPLKNKQDVHNLGRVVQHYALIKNEAPLYLGHNPLQQLTYSTLYVAGFIQMCTGLVLFSLYHQSNPIWEFIGTPIHWFGIPGVRLFHTAIMFAIWMFVIMHVYLAVRADSLERHGGISSMINGGVWLRAGAKPVDAPEVG